MKKVTLNPETKFNYNQIPNHKFEFAFLTPDWKVMHTPFQCKDYFQDILWCEYTKNDHGVSVYGLNWKYGMLDLKQKKLRIALFGGLKKLRERVKPLQKFLNAFEEKQRIGRSKVYETDDDYIIVVEFSKKWTQCGPLMSAFTTLIRISGAYSGEDPMEYLKGLLSMAKNTNSIKPDYILVDVIRLTNTLKKLAGLYAGLKVKHKWSDLSSGMRAHTTGIMGFTDFPTVDV